MAAISVRQRTDRAEAPALRCSLHLLIQWEFK
jgi:hypothetical protein